MWSEIDKMERVERECRGRVRIEMERERGKERREIDKMEREERECRGRERWDR